MYYYYLRYIQNNLNMFSFVLGIAVKFILKLIEETKAFQEVNAQYTPVPIDECKMHKFKSDKYWECYLRHISNTMYHPVTTCKMGRSDDKTAVVDTKLRYWLVKLYTIIIISV